MVQASEEAMTSVAAKLGASQGDVAKALFDAEVWSVECKYPRSCRGYDILLLGDCNRFGAVPVLPTVPLCRHSSWGRPLVDRD